VAKLANAAASEAVP